MMFERFHILWFCICNNYATVFIDVFILQRKIFFRFITIFELLSSNIYFFACILSCIGVYSITVCIYTKTRLLDVCVCVAEFVQNE